MKKKPSILLILFLISIVFCIFSIVLNALFEPTHRCYPESKLSSVHQLEYVLNVDRVYSVQNEKYYNYSSHNMIVGAYDFTPDLRNTEFYVFFRDSNRDDLGVILKNPNENFTQEDIENWDEVYGVYQSEYEYQLEVEEKHKYDDIKNYCGLFLISFVTPAAIYLIVKLVRFIIKRVAKKNAKTV